MTYVTGQPIIFVGCGQVPLVFFCRLDLLIDLYTDVYGSEAIESGECRTSHSQ
jgi:hypothetical protein